MSTTASPRELTAGRLVTFETPSGDTRTGRIVESEWAPTYGNPDYHLTVRVGGTELRITDAELV